MLVGSLEMEARRFLLTLRSRARTCARNNDVQLSSRSCKSGLFVFQFNFYVDGIEKVAFCGGDVYLIDHSNKTARVACQHEGGKFLESSVMVRFTLIESRLPTLATCLILTRRLCASTARLRWERMNRVELLLSIRICSDFKVWYNIKCLII